MIFTKFWEWYERNYKLNIGITSLLFLLQIFHLIWLFVEVIWAKIFGTPLLYLSGAPKLLILLVDYTEIPALISVSLIYINDIRKNGFKPKPVFYIFALLVQLIHIFWITDEFVLTTFSGEGPIVNIPAWLAWVAILIDYLELPVIFETLKKLKTAFKKGGLDDLRDALK